MIPDQSPQSANCSRPSKPPAVPSKNPHYCWGGFSKPPVLVKSRIDVDMSETIFFLPFLTALKMALAGAFSKEPRLKTGGVEGGESGGTSISLTKLGPFFVFDSKAVMFYLFLDNC
jgi:hypothetical protein